MHGGGVVSGAVNAMRKRAASLLACFLAIGLAAPVRGARAAQQQARLPEEALLSLVQRKTFAYFWEGSEPTSGMALESIHVGNEFARNRDQRVTTGGSGFGLMALLVGVERGFVGRPAAVERTSRDVPRQA